MINWNVLEHPDALEQLIENSRTTPCLIFKHSDRCSISYIVQHRLEGDWDIPNSALAPYHLDVIGRRALSNQVAERFGVIHESPQVLLIENGRCRYHTSHLDISVSGIRACLQEDLA